jgi:MtN3 and saliva related transmembrane protein
MLIVLCTGIILWLVYGFYVRDIPIIAANIVTFLFASMILVLKIRYKTEESQSTTQVSEGKAGEANAEG